MKCCLKILLSISCLLFFSKVQAQAPAEGSFTIAEQSFVFPSGGGDIILHVTSFVVYECFQGRFSMNPRSSSCYSSRPDPEDEDFLIPVSLDRLPEMLDIKYGSENIFYSVDTANATITLHYNPLSYNGGTGLPRSGNIIFYYKNFAIQSFDPDFIMSEWFPFICGNLPLSGGRIQGVNSTPLAPGSIPGPITNVEAASGGGYGNYSYQWQYSKDTSLGTKELIYNITGATGFHYQPSTPITNTTYFRRKVTSGMATAYTPWVAAEVKLQIGTVTPSKQTILSGSVPRPLAVTNVSGGGKPYNYAWEKKQAYSSVTISLNESRDSIFQPLVLNQKTLFRCYVSSGTQGIYTEWVSVNIAGEPNMPDYYSSTVGLNYIVACSPQVAVKDIGELTKDDLQRASSVTYYDGLGRPIQTVLPLHTPAGKDLVSRIEYDAVGREGKKYLPVPVAGGSNAGAYVAPTSLQTKADEFYGSNSRAFAETRYEPSPLNRVTEQLMPGAAWATHPLQTDYQTNASAIGSWRVTDNVGAYAGITYPAASLYVAQQKDADGRAVREYKDKLGQVVMTEMNDGTQWLQTRFVYDDLGLQRVVLQPEATNITDSANCFYYRYDTRRRVSEKKLPGAAWQHFVYDTRDRLVFSQDGNQRTARQWKHYVYDNLNREIKTEIWQLTTGYTREAIQNYVSGTPPAGATVIFNDETRYGDYPTLPDSLAFLVNDLVSAHATSNKTRITLQKTAVLNSTLTTQTTLTTVFYYDDYGRVVQTVAINHLGGTDRISTKYDFRGNPLQTLQISSWKNDDDEEESITLLTTFEYDALKRPTDVKLKINNGTEVTISHTEYDELLRVKKKTLHNGAEAIEYAYNIQNWLTSISSPLFTETLQYEQPTLEGIIPQWNGNISAMTWRNNALAERKYAFTYDGVNRLKGAQHTIGAGGPWGNPYTEHLTYDKNGNVKTLKRYGYGPLIDNMALNYNGNQLTQITDNATADGFPLGTSNYGYDANGNMTLDGTVTLTYNVLNLPQQVQLTAGRSIENTYAADGRKLYTEAKEGSQLKEGTKYYNGNLVLDKNKELEYIIFPEGRIIKNNTNFVYEYHLRDHLGSVRVAFTPIGIGKQVVQENAYYPFGAPIKEECWGASDNRYKHTGMETVSDFGLGYMDNDARWRPNPFNPPGFMGIDPLAEKYPQISPYVYCANNPMRFIDPTGMMYSEHIDEFGNMIAHYDDGDNSVYMHNNGTTQKQIDQQRSTNSNTGGTGQKIGELGGEIDVSLIMPNKLALSSEAVKKVSGLIEFGGMVQTGSALDLKNNTETIFGVAWTYDLENGASTKFSFGDYSNMTAADVGNYHFGYIGRYTNNGEGFSPNTLWIGAGLAEIKKNIFDEGKFSTGLKGFTQLFGTGGPRPPFGDNMVDFVWSTVGMGDADKSKKR